MKINDIWIVGQFRKKCIDGVIWDFQGAFTTEAAAINACRNQWYFYYKIQTDTELPDEPVTVDVVYPMNVMDDEVKKCITCWRREGDRCYEGDPLRLPDGRSTKMADKGCDKYYDKQKIMKTLFYSEPPSSQKERE